jgi:hypothetical protein
MSRIPESSPKYKREQAETSSAQGAPRSVYSGQERLGHVTERITPGGIVEFVAHDRQQTAFGVYDSWNAAATAIVRRSWGAR